MRVHHLLALLAVALWAAPALRAQQQPDPVRIPIECEDMQGIKTGLVGFTPDWTFGKWGRDLHQNMIFGGVWASRLAAAITDAGDNAAEVYQDITVPRTGRYKIWAKYECPPNFNYAFAIRIAPLDANGQPGQPVFTKTYGLRESAKHFCFNSQLVTGDLFWSWGIDHDAAEGYETDLPTGKYRVTLAKAPGVKPEGERSVDAILITSRLTELSAPDYPRYPLLDELQQINHVYFRFTNTGAAPIKVSYDHWNHKPEHYYSMGPKQRAMVRFHDSDGNLLRDAAGQPLLTSDGQWGKAIAPGQSSPWIDVGPTMVTENSSPFSLNAVAVDVNGANLAQQPADVPFTVDLALSPNGAAIVKSFAKVPGEPILTLDVQPDLHRAEGVEWTVTGQQLYERITRALEAQPRVGPVPGKIRLYGGSGGIYGWGGTFPSELAFKSYADYRIALGLNTLGYDGADPAMSERLLAYYKTRNTAIVELSGIYHHTQTPADLQKVYADPKASQRLYYNSFGDEIGLPAVNINDQALLADFRAFLTARKIKPQELGFATLAEVKPLASYTPDAAALVGVLPTNAGSKPVLPEGEAGARIKRLYWYTHQFTIARGIADFAKKTEAMAKIYGPQFKTSANLGGMHPFYWMHQSSFIESFRGKAMTLAWSEDYDYCQPEVSRLCIEFQGAYLRAGAKYHDTPMMFYAMPHYPGNTARHLTQNVVNLWGQGVKDIDFFNVSPDLFSTENYIHSRGGMETAGAIRRISGMAGNVENELVPARTRKAKIAILLSEASDVWELCGRSQWDVKPGSTETNVSQEERKDTWYALRNAGYLVDLITENDVVDGILKGYRVLYVSGRNMEGRTAKTIGNWVKAGGVLYLTTGAARRDEADQPLTTLDGVVGRGKVVKYDPYLGPLRGRLELIWLEPKDVASAKPGANMVTYNALAAVETFAPAKGAKVLGSFISNGLPSLVRMKAGKGLGFYTGTLPGQAFAKKAIPVRVMGKGGSDESFSHFEPVNFDDQAREVILAPVRAAGLQPEAVINRPNIVATILDGPAATVVTLTNLGRNLNGVAKNVTITLANVRPATSVFTALKAAGAKAEQKGSAVTVTLPELDDADVIVLRH